MNHESSPPYRLAADKRVLMVLSELSRGGVERQLLTLADGLLARGYQIEIFELAGSPGGETTFDAELAALGIKSRRASQFTDITNLEQDLPDDHGLQPFAPLLSHLSVVRLGVALDKAIKDFQPQIVHCWSDIANVIGGFVAAALGVPKIVLGHRSVPANRTNGADCSLYQRAYRNLTLDPTTAHVSNSVNNAKAYEAWIGAEADTVTVIHNGYPSYGVTPSGDGHFGSREILGIPPGALVVGAVMRFSPEKDPALWLETASAIAKARGDVWFMLAGYGPLRDEVHRTVAASDVAKRCVLLGPVKDVGAISRCIDVFLMTSRFEGTPNALIEAQACGIPVVGPFVGGISEVVHEGVTGLVIPDRRSDKLADAVLRILGNANWRRQAAVSGPAFIAERFDAARMIDRMVELYDARRPYRASVSIN